MFFFFNDNKKELFEAFELPHIKEVAASDEFYFHKAKDKFDELTRYDISDINLNTLIAATKASNFSFEKWLNTFDMSSAEYKLLFLIGQVVSYFDTNAAMKNKLNEYEDKRVLAKAMVRQHIWVKWLLEFKAGADINSFPGNIRNAIMYIQHPESNLSMLSEDHKRSIAEKLFNGEYPDIFTEMKTLGIMAENPSNNGVLYTMIFYSDAIRETWLEINDEFDIFNEYTEKKSSYLPYEVVIEHLGGVRKTHNVLTRAKLYELNDGRRVLIRGSKLLPAGRYFYGLQNGIVESDEKIDFLILVRACCMN